MKLYNTLTRTRQTVEPLHAPSVSIYTCGPTVYDYPHVGNWFTFIRYDLLVRALSLEGLKPRWVMNITDVGHLVGDADEGEDKLQKGANREGRTAWDVARFYSDYFTEGLDRLNITLPDELPRATEHISEQIDLIRTLEDKGYTYVIDDGVYYDTAKFEGYAAFARLDMDDLQAGARVEHNTQKRQPGDFALWKFSPKHAQRDMEWDSPWGKGFPGWHLECSAMSMKYLGETMDIHAGGIDHIPVHHTNEIAQSEAATGKRFANHWMHANHITIEGDKISKSLGNGITLEDIEGKGFDLETFRLHVLESHYRSQSKFSWAALEAARNRLKGLRAMADLRFQARETIDVPVSYPDWENYKQAIGKHLSDDLNTPQALMLLSEVENSLDVPLTQKETTDFAAFLRFIDDALGLNLLGSDDIGNDMKDRIQSREAARASKDWSASDKLRDELSAQGIGVRDAAAGTIWFRL